MYTLPLMMKDQLGEVVFQINLKDSLFNRIRLSFLIRAQSLLNSPKEEIDRICFTSGQILTIPLIFVMIWKNL